MGMVAAIETGVTRKSSGGKSDRRQMTAVKCQASLDRRHLTSGQPLSFGSI